MFQFQDKLDLITYGNTTKIVLNKRFNEWHIADISRAVPLKAAEVAFHTWFKYRPYIGSCNGEILTAELNRALNGSALFVGDRFIDNHGVETLFDVDVHAEREIIDVDRGAMAHAMTLGKYLIPKHCESIADMTAYYNPAVKSMLIYSRGNLIGKIPLLS